METKTKPATRKHTRTSTSKAGSKTNPQTLKQKPSTDKPLTQRSSQTMKTVSVKPLAGKLLHQYFLASNEPTFFLDPFSGVVLHANTAAKNFFRRPGVSLEGLTIDKLYPKSNGQLYVFTDEALTKGFARTRELELFRPDGERIYIEHTANAVKHDDVHCLIIRLLDIDALHQRDFKDGAESYLKKGLQEWFRDEKYFRDIEREHKLILAAAGEGIYGVDVEGRTTFLNPASEAILGYSKEELIGRKMHDLIHHSHSDGTVYPHQECPIYNAFREGTVNTSNNEVFWHKHGHAVHVEFTSTPIVDNDVLVGAVIVFRDVSERKKNEEQLQKALIENANLREKLELENEYLQEEIRSRGIHDNIVGSSEPLKALLNQIDLVAPTDANVLIHGESGTGKELIAHEIHRGSSRSSRPLISVNCAAIPRELFESEFFGHVKGSFSGATRDRVGRFQLADGGTLFLDEVGELELGLQAKLLRVVQEGKYERVGEERSRNVNVRLIAATNKDLRKAVEKETFREDLYFRLNVFPIECTPLRQRTEDIPVLAAHYLKVTCARLNLPPLQLSRANVNAMVNYSWPGNIRELQNVIERAAIVASKGKLQFDLQTTNNSHNQQTIKESQQLEPNDKILTEKEIIELERNNMLKALKACNGRVSGADGVAAMLGMKPTTVYSRIKAWRLKI